MAVQIKRPETAFANAFVGKQRKSARQKIEAHLQFIRGLPCLITGKRPVDPAHIRYADMRYGKRMTGAGEKADDMWVVPLHRSVHDDQHNSGDEFAWWRSHGIDPLFVAMALYRASGDDDAAEQIIRSARPSPSPERAV